jgi:threonine synthase
VNSRAETKSFLSHLECPKCGQSLAADRLQNLCAYGSPLLVRYDLDAVAGSVRRDALAVRPPTLWRYAELLPIRDRGAIVTLGEGCTPVFPLRRLGRACRFAELHVKDEGLCPTGSFKARGAAVGVSRALELGAREVAMPTAGNAGGAWAAYCATAGLRIHVAMPRDAPAVNQAECRLYGAELTLVDGLISDAGKLVQQGIRQHGWFDASTLREPYRIRLTGRRRRRGHRHLEGLRRVAAHRLAARTLPAAAGRRAGRGLRAAGARVAGGPHRVGVLAARADGRLGTSGAESAG